MKQETLPPSTLRLCGSRVMQFKKKKAKNIKKRKQKNHDGNLFHALRIVDNFAPNGF